MPKISRPIGLAAGLAAATAIARPRKLPARPRRSPSPLLCLSLVASLALSAGFGLACGLYGNHTELRESKRMSDCRLRARRACRRLAKQDPSIEIEACTSDRSWQCALDNSDASDKSSGRTTKPNETQ